MFLLYDFLFLQNRNDWIFIFNVCCFNKILDNFIEDFLVFYEYQVEVMKNYYDGNKEIFKFVERREIFFKIMEEFEVFVIYLFICMVGCD